MYIKALWPSEKSKAFSPAIVYSTTGAHTFAALRFEPLLLAMGVEMKLTPASFISDSSKLPPVDNYALSSFGWR